MQTEHAARNPTEPLVPAPEDVVLAYFAALNNSDVERITALFAEDGVVMADDYPSAIGKSEIRDMFEGAFAATRMQMHCQVDRVVEGDPLAVVRAHATGTLTLLDPGTTIGQEHRELYVLRRSADAWHITEYMFNSPAATAP